jgi:hypothetical protein
MRRLVMAVSGCEYAGTKPQHERAHSPDLKPAVAESRNSLADFENDKF